MSISKKYYFHEDHNQEYQYQEEVRDLEYHVLFEPWLKWLVQEVLTYPRPKNIITKKKFKIKSTISYLNHG